MNNLNNICSEYIGDPNYVFKSCGNYLVVLQKLHDTITNESRSDISNPMYATYRANKLRVIFIINKFDPFDVITEVHNTSYKDNKIIYETDKIVEEPYYDMYLDQTYAKGIHYFKTVESAFYWQLIDFNIKYTGKYIDWYENGNKKEEIEYLAGRLVGKYISWHSNGNKCVKGEFLDDERTGKWIEYWYNGNKECEGEYSNGIFIGKWIYWDPNGNIECEGECLDNGRGKWIYWYTNGNKEKEGEYLDRKETGKWTYWHENGNKWTEGEYLDGKETGKWIFYYENGNIQSEGEYLDGKKTGLWIYYYENGNKMYECEGNEMDWII